MNVSKVEFCTRGDRANETWFRGLRAGQVLALVSSVHSGCCEIAELVEMKCAKGEAGETV